MGKKTSMRIIELNFW